MDKAEKNESESDVSKAIHAAMSDPKYWAKRRSNWDEWGSPVGLSLGWALFIIPLGVFIYFLFLSGLIR